MKRISCGEGFFWYFCSNSPRSGKKVWGGDGWLFRISKFLALFVSAKMSLILSRGLPLAHKYFAFTKEFLKGLSISFVRTLQSLNLTPVLDV